MKTSNKPKVQKELAPTTNIILDDKQRSWWNSMSDKQRRFITSLSIVLGVSLLALIAFYFAKREIQAYRADKAESQSFGDNKHATWAKQLTQAFENDSWWGMGTNEELIRQIFLEIPSKEDFREVEKKYSLITQGSNLIKDLTSELSTTEYEEMLAIKNSKPEKYDPKRKYKVYDPQGWAKRIHSAVHYETWGMFWGTDLEAIKAVFNEIPSQKAFYQMAFHYKKKYGVSVWDDLDGDVSSSDYNWRAVLKKKPKN